MSVETATKLSRSHVQCISGVLSFCISSQKGKDVCAEIFKFIVLSRYSPNLYYFLDCDFLFLFSFTRRTKRLNKK